MPRATCGYPASSQSVFQLVGAGQVGRGSLYGMQALHRLAGAGFGSGPSTRRGCRWSSRSSPGSSPSPVRKNSPSEQERYLEAVPIPPDLRRLAAAGEDAFDAAVLGGGHGRRCRRAACTPRSARRYEVEA